MKRIIAAIVIYHMFVFPSYAINDAIVDDFADSYLDKTLKIENNQQVQITDDFADSVLPKDLKIKKENFNREFLNKTVKISPLKNYSTADNLKEGEYIDFVLAEDINLENTIYKKGTNIKARIENISLNQGYGVPADIVIGNFMLDDKIPLDATISKTGANRAIWVYPATIGLSALLGLGLLFIPIRGGHAKLKKKEVFELEI